MAEWSIAAVLKTARPKGLRGSNPLPSSRLFRIFAGSGLGLSPQGFRTGCVSSLSGGHTPNQHERRNPTEQQSPGPLNSRKRHDAGYSPPDRKLSQSKRLALPPVTHAPGSKRSGSMRILRGDRRPGSHPSPLNGPARPPQTVFDTTSRSRVRVRAARPRV